MKCKECKLEQWLKDQESKGWTVQDDALVMRIKGARSDKAIS